jgi:hypothetical protein
MVEVSEEKVNKLLVTLIFVQILVRGDRGLIFSQPERKFLKILSKSYLKACKFSVCSRKYFVKNKEAVRFIDQFSL